MKKDALDVAIDLFKSRYPLYQNYGMHPTPDAQVEILAKAWLEKRAGAFPICKIPDSLIDKLTAPEKS